MDNDGIIQLTKPITYLNDPAQPQGESNPELTIKSLTVKKRPTVADQIEGYRRARGGNQAAIECYLMSVACDVPHHLMMQVDIYDYQKVVEEYTFFMETPLTTG